MKPLASAVRANENKLLNVSDSKPVVAQTAFPIDTVNHDCCGPELFVTCRLVKSVGLTPDETTAARISALEGLPSNIERTLLMLDLRIHDIVGFQALIYANEMMGQLYLETLVQLENSEAEKALSWITPFYTPRALAVRTNSANDRAPIFRITEAR